MYYKGKRIFWPFSVDDLGDVVLAPWGVFGASYAVPDDATYKRLKNQLGQMFAMVTNSLTVACLTFISFSHPTQWRHILFLGATGNAIRCAVSAFYITHSQARKMKLAHSRPVLIVALRRSAQKTDTPLLWAGQILGIVLFCIFTAAPASHNVCDAIQRATFFMLGTTITLLFSLLIFLKNTAHPDVRR